MDVDRRGGGGLRRFFIRPVVEISQFYMQLTGNTLPIGSPRLQYKRAKVCIFLELNANMLGGTGLHAAELHSGWGYLMTKQSLG